MLKKNLKTEKQEPLLKRFFIKNDETQNVEVQEVNEIDLEEVKRHLENGKSVYIKQKETKPDANFIAYKREKEPWCLIRS